MNRRAIEVSSNTVDHRNSFCREFPESFMNTAVIETPNVFEMMCEMLECFNGFRLMSGYLQPSPKLLEELDKHRKLLEEKYTMYQVPMATQSDSVWMFETLSYAFKIDSNTPYRITFCAVRAMGEAPKKADIYMIFDNLHQCRVINPKVFDLKNFIAYEPHYPDLDRAARGFQLSNPTLRYEIRYSNIPKLDAEDYNKKKMAILIEHTVRDEELWPLVDDLASKGWIPIVPITASYSHTTWQSFTDMDVEDMMDKIEHSDAICIVNRDKWYEDFSLEKIILNVLSKDTFDKDYYYVYPERGEEAPKHPKEYIWKPRYDNGDE